MTEFTGSTRRTACDRWLSIRLCRPKEIEANIDDFAPPQEEKVSAMTTEKKPQRPSTQAGRSIYASIIRKHAYASMHAVETRES